MIYMLCYLKVRKVLTIQSPLDNCSFCPDTTLFTFTMLKVYSSKALFLHKYHQQDNFSSTFVFSRGMRFKSQRCGPPWTPSGQGFIQNLRLKIVVERDFLPLRHTAAHFVTPTLIMTSSSLSCELIFVHNLHLRVHFSQEKKSSAKYAGRKFSNKRLAKNNLSCQSGHKRIQTF